MWILFSPRDTISSRSLSAMIYPKVAETQNKQSILCYQTFGGEESYSFFTTEDLVVKIHFHSLLQNIW